MSLHKTAHKILIIAITLFTLVFLYSCGGGGGQSQTSVSVSSAQSSVSYKTIPDWAKGYFAAKDDMDQSQTDTQKEADISAKLGSMFKTRSADATVQVIFKLKSGFVPEGFLSSTEKATQRQDISTLQNHFISSLKSKSSFYNSAKFAKFSTIPYIVTKVKQSDVAAISSLSGIDSVQEDQLSSVSLTESTPLIGGTTAHNEGYTGSGETVAILDTGVDKSHPFLTGRVVSEACYSNAGGAGSGTSVCPGGATSSTATGSGTFCSLSVTGCDHGTHVAGIVAGSNSSMSGVAPGAKIIAIQVFTNISGQALSYTSDQMLGLERVYALKDTYNIASVNMSLGGGSYSSACDSDARKTIIDNLRSVGIATVIASGNNGYTTTVSAPGCISTAETVGSTGDGSGGTVADSVSSYSNSSSLVDFLAPGQYITSSVPNSSYATWAGTSMATPHVAGAFAVIKAMQPSATVDQIENALKATGKKITDTRNGLVFPRIQLDSALSAMGTGSVTVNISPASAVSAGAQWRLDSGSWQNSGATVSSVSIGVHTVTFKTATSSSSSSTWVTPFQQTATIAANGDTANITGTYVSRSISQKYKDFDGNGTSDILFRSTTDGSLYGWLMSGFAIASRNYMALADGTVIKPSASSWSVEGVGDFNGDGYADILLRSQTDGSYYIWFLQGTQIIGRSYITLDTAVMKPGLTSWSTAAIGDVNGDGKADIVFRSLTDGSLYIWEMDGSSIYYRDYVRLSDSSIPKPALTSWSVNGLADSNGDGKADILFRSLADGSLYLWQMNGTTIASRDYARLPDTTIVKPGLTSWSIAGYADTGGDGMADIIFRSLSDGSLYVWQMNGTTIATRDYMKLADGTIVKPGLTSWSIEDILDTNGDGKYDVLFRNLSTGSLYIWQMSDKTITNRDYIQLSDTTVLQPALTSWLSGY